jgi:arginine deiminase
MTHESRRLAEELIEGVPYHDDTDPDRFRDERYTLKPLYNLFFTRDASSSVY